MRFAFVRADNAREVWDVLPRNYVIVSGSDPLYLIGGVDEGAYTLDLIRAVADGREGVRSVEEVTDLLAVRFIRERRAS